MNQTRLANHKDVINKAIQTELDWSNSKEELKERRHDTESLKMDPIYTQ